MICEILIFAPLNFVSKFDKNGLVSFEYKYLTMIDFYIDPIHKLFNTKTK
jgi:hypothetical protein